MVRPWRHSGTGILLAVTAALVANCSTDLRRDDLDGRPCPCLDGWDCRESTSGRICVRSTGTGGIGGGSALHNGGGTGLTPWAGAGGTDLSLSGAGMSGTLVPDPQAGVGNIANVVGAGSSAIVGAAGASGSYSSSTGGDVALGGTVNTGAVSSGGTSETGGSYNSGGTVSSAGSDNTAGSVTSGGTNNNAGGGTSAVNGAAGSAGRLSCQAPLSPPTSVGNCRPPCNNCDGGVCNINCTSQGDCSIPAMACPFGMPCRVTCSGQKSCERLLLTCNQGYACDVVCNGNQSCSGLVVDCANSGACSLTCTNMSKACDGATTLSCGSNDCRAICEGSVRPNVEHCENSCRSPDCGCI